MSSNPANNTRPQIESVTPPAAISGGEFEIRGQGFTANGNPRVRARFGRVNARLVVGGSRYVVVRVPEDATEGELVVENASSASHPFGCAIGLTIAENLHPVANPAVDNDGNVFTTRSGTRGEKLPVSVFKIDLNFDVKPFISDIVNPTGLIFNHEGTLLISGRNNGTIYAVTRGGQMEVYAEGMGVASGLALDRDQNLYVGDRTGTIFKISPDRQIYVFATMEPSISAYHLAMGSDGYLYASGPTTSSFDSVYRITPKGEVEIYYRGFGRPQGLVFDERNNLYVAASHAGRKGVFRITPDQKLEQVISGPGIVGLAFLPTQEMILATNSTIYRVETAGWLNRK
jgi:sugar lactone lactonase YvrE